MKSYSKIFERLVKAYSDVPRALLPGYALPVLQVCFELTYRCNLSCEMCQFFQFAKDDQSRRSVKDELSYEEVVSIIDRFPFYTLITFTGGELFLRKDIMKILDYCSRNRRFTVVTNGTMVDREKAEALVRMGTKSIVGKGLYLLEVSLEGGKETHESISKVGGSYEKTVEAIRLFSEARKRSGRRFPLLNIKTVITPRNVGDISWLYEFASEAGADFYNPMIHSRLEVTADRLASDRRGCIDEPPPKVLEVDTRILASQLDEISRKQQEQGRPEIRFSPLGITSSEVVKYYKGELDLMDYSCRPPWYLAGVSPYGDVTVCSYFKHGNVRNTPFGKIWNGSDIRRLRRMIKEKERFPGCLGCCNMTYIGR